MQGVYEQFFLFKQRGGWSLIELYNLPVGLRNWFFSRLVKFYEDQSEKTKR